MSRIIHSQDFFEKQVQQRSSAGSNSYVHLLLHSSAEGLTNGGEDVPREPIRLSKDLWLCRISDKYRDIVYEACESPGSPRRRAICRQYTQIYTIVFFGGPWLPGQPSGWDSDGQIKSFVRVAQLIHPTTIGFGNTARLTFDAAGGFLEAAPGPCRGMGEQAFVLPNHRNWLSSAECQEICSLLRAPAIVEPPERVKRAEWSVLHAAYQHYFQVRLMLVTVGLEALVHTERKNTGGQFRTRVTRLAFVVGEQLSAEDAENLWDHRSEVVHGGDPWSTGAPEDLSAVDAIVKLYVKAETLLRKTVLKCLREADFARQFDSSSTIETAFPLAQQPL